MMHKWEMTECQKKIKKAFEKFGQGKVIVVKEWPYEKEVSKFIDAIEKAHQDAKHSKLKFGY